MSRCLLSNRMQTQMKYVKCRLHDGFSFHSHEMDIVLKWMVRNDDAVCVCLCDVLTTKVTDSPTNWVKTVYSEKFKESQLKMSCDETTNRFKIAANDDKRLSSQHQQPHCYLPRFLAVSLLAFTSNLPHLALFHSRPTFNSLIQALVSEFTFPSRCSIQKNAYRSLG